MPAVMTTEHHADLLASLAGQRTLPTPMLTGLLAIAEDLPAGPYWNVLARLVGRTDITAARARALLPADPADAATRTSQTLAFLNRSDLEEHHVAEFLTSLADTSKLNWFCAHITNPRILERVIDTVTIADAGLLSTLASGPGPTATRARALDVLLRLLVNNSSAHPSSDDRPSDDRPSDDGPADRTGGCAGSDALIDAATPQIPRACENELPGVHHGTAETVTAWGHHHLPRVPADTIWRTLEALLHLSPVPAATRLVAKHVTTLLLELTSPTESTDGSGGSGGSEGAGGSDAAAPHLSIPLQAPAGRVLDRLATLSHRGDAHEAHDALFTLVTVLHQRRVRRAGLPIHTAFAMRPDRRKSLADRSWQQVCADTRARKVSTTQLSLTLTSLLGDDPRAWQLWAQLSPIHTGTTTELADAVRALRTPTPTTAARTDSTTDSTTDSLTDSTTGTTAPTP